MVNNEVHFHDYCCLNYIEYYWSKLSVVSQVLKSAFLFNLMLCNNYFLDRKIDDHHRSVNCQVRQVFQ